MSMLVVRNLAAPVVITRRDPLVMRPMYGTVIATTSGGFNHSQPSASDEWIINHNLGYQPNVQAFSVGGVEIVCQVVHTSNNQTRIYFLTPTAGTARLI